MPVTGRPKMPSLPQLGFKSVMIFNMICKPHFSKPICRQRFFLRRQIICLSGVGLSNADFIAMTQFVGVRPVVNLIDNDDAAPAGPIGPPPAVVAPMMGPDPPAAAPEVAPEGDGDVAMDDNDEGQVLGPGP